MDPLSIEKLIQNPPEDLSPELSALLEDRKGNWHFAHEIVQWLPGKGPARVHAYLHRKEGDRWNADYWYSRAGEARPDISLDEEWEMLMKRFLK